MKAQNYFEAEPYLKQAIEMSKKIKDDPNLKSPLPKYLNLYA